MAGRPTGRQVRRVTWGCRDSSPRVGHRALSSFARLGRRRRMWRIPSRPRSGRRLGRRDGRRSHPSFAGFRSVLRRIDSCIRKGAFPSPSQWENHSRARRGSRSNSRLAQGRLPRVDGDKAKKTAENEPNDEPERRHHSFPACRTTRSDNASPMLSRDRDLNPSRDLGPTNQNLPSPANQNLPFSWAISSGIAEITSQCSTILPSCTRNRS